MKNIIYYIQGDENEEYWKIFDTIKKMENSLIQDVIEIIQFKNLKC